MARKSLAVILAAGEATRMKSSKSKVLHPVGNWPMVAHVAAAARDAGVDHIALVVGRAGEEVAKAAGLAGVPVTPVEQTERKGTGHATLMAKDIIAEGFDDVVVLYGDGPLIDPETLKAAVAARAGGADMVVIGFRAADPTGYGRMVVENGELLEIVEHRDASDEIRKIDFCNGGIITMSGDEAVSLLEAIDNKNAKGEYYLTDVVSIARSRGRKVIPLEAPEADMMGCNTRAELAEIEAEWQRRKRLAAMLDGASLIDPSTVWLSYDTRLGRDVVIEPNVWFGPGVTVEDGAVIHAFSHLEGAHVGKGVSVGPFARLRPEARLAEGSKVGNFCEVKKAEIGPGAKVNHLTYIGDATVGAGANIGAGTITCNYDGENKSLTVIGENAFVGSNSALVAPVTVGRNAYVAAGSTITKDVPDDALAVARGRQENYAGRSTVLRERARAIKAARKAEKAKS
jgi:UDP-N-acetylglucosamine diphosphorylase/glucosamine-1-phosphate N-acetyltransferase